MGRASTFTQDKADEICDRIAKGEPLAQICRDEHMPSDNTVRNWMVEREEFAAAIARARVSGFDRIAEDCLAISDEGSGDAQRDKLRVDTRLKLLAKWDPKRYGESVQLKHADADGNKVDLADAPAAARLAALLEAVRQRTSEDGSSPQPASEPEG